MIRVVRDDLAFVAADAVVRPTTTRLEPTSSSLRTLERVGGPAFWKQLEVHDDLAVGSAVVTPGGDLPASLVIHAVIAGPDQPVTLESARRALRSALERARDWQVEHLAIPPIGVGAGNLAPEDAAALLADELDVIRGTATYPNEITIVVDREEDLNIFTGRLRPLLEDH